MSQSDKDKIRRLKALVEWCAEWLPENYDVECPDEKADLTKLRVAIKELLR